MGEIILKDSSEMIELIGAMDHMDQQLDLIEKDCKPTLSGERYLTDRELSDKLRVSRRTLQDWRNNGKIEYYQLEGKILYAESAVQRLLDQHYQKAWG